MPFTPWGEQPALAPGAPQKQPQKQKKNWWEQGLANLEQAGGISMPWQAKHWDPQFTPEWARGAGMAGGIVGGMAGLGALGLAAPGLIAGAPGMVPWLSQAAGRMAMPGAFGGLTQAALPAARGGVGQALKAVPQWMGRHKALTGLGLGAGAIGLANLPGGEAGLPQPPSPGQMGTGLEGLTAMPPGAPPGTEGGPPEPGAGEGGGPDIRTDADGNKWILNEFTGQWTMIQPQQVRGLTPEQTMAESLAEREAAMARRTATDEASMARMRENIAAEEAAMQAQFTGQRGMQEAGAAQQMAQMYAQDPYKYWAQMGLGTPEAVSRLTQGDEGIAPGEQFQPGVPLSMPSQQWWGNLLPSEQQQIMGGLNWMGIDPADWQATRMRMIPGMQSRQMEARFAR